MKHLTHTCPVCNGDGKETCGNPDHGLFPLLAAVGRGHYRHGCPVCGWDERHKIPGGGKCDQCNGIGRVTEKECEYILIDFEIDKCADEFIDTTGIFIAVPS